MQAKARQGNIPQFRWFALYDGVLKSTVSVISKLRDFVF